MLFTLSFPAYVRRSGNCSVDLIPLSSPDLELDEHAHMRLKHAKEMLDADPDQFVYKGKVTERSYSTCIELTL